MPPSLPRASAGHTQTSLNQESGPQRARSQCSRSQLTPGQLRVDSGPMEGTRSVLEVSPRFLPLQFDKFSPKLDSPYFRHSNVSPVRRSSSCRLGVWGSCRFFPCSLLDAEGGREGEAVLKGPPPWGHSPELSLSLAALPTLPSHRPWAAHPACTPWPLWVPAGRFSAQGTAVPGREVTGRWVGLGHGAGLQSSSRFYCNLALD